MNHDLPHVKTVKLLFVAMDDQQQAMFRMAFKMHNTTNYEVIGAHSGEKPELVIVDGDSNNGLTAWQKAKNEFPNSVIVYFSKTPPAVTAPYLAKPIKFDSLFMNLRNLLQGNGVWVVRAGTAHTSAAPAQPKTVSTEHSSHRSAEVTIPRFDPSTGILGAFREVLESQRNTAILVDENPVLAVFPSTQRVWIAVDSDHLKSLCQQDKINLKLKHIPDENNVQDRANATVTSSMWQIALWTANGRLVNPLNPDTVFHLKSWPNLTRLAPLPEAMRLSAFLTKTSVNLNMLYKLLPLDMKDILNYIAATYLTDYLTVTQQTGNTAATQSATRATVDTSATPKPEQVRAARPSPAHAKQDEGGLLSRFMKKLLNR